MLFSYVGPETLLPLTSTAAAVLGAVLLFWRRGLSLLMSVGRIARGSTTPASQPVPGEGQAPARRRRARRVSS
ncbi:MAG: hypothetical protein U0835_18065 [Isosphaeraceae bacterium]